MNGELPEGWTDKLIGEIAEVIGGGTPDTKDQGNFSVTEGVPWITPADLSDYKEMYISRGRRFLTAKGLKNSSARLMPRGTVLFSSRAPIGYVAIAANEISTNQGFKSFVCKDDVVPEYLYFWLRHAKPLAENLASGTTFAEISGKNAARIPIRFPPVDEQHQIAAKLQELFPKVEACQSRLAKVPLILKRFRQSVLAAACSGRLTEDWREKNPIVQTARELMDLQPPKRKEGKKRAGRLWGAGEVPKLSVEDIKSLPLSWAWTKVATLGDDMEETVQVGPMSMQSRDFRKDGIPVLNVGCVQQGWIDERKLDYMPAEKAAAFSRYRVLADDILFTRSGTVGRCALAEQRQNGWLMTFHLLRVRVDPNKCLPRYLLFALQGSPNIIRQTLGAAIGSTRAGYNTRLLAQLDVPLPPWREQHEIIRRVQSLFDLAAKVESMHKSAQAKVRMIVFSILNRAFRGELI